MSKRCGKDGCKAWVVFGTVLCKIHQAELDGEEEEAVDDATAEVAAADTMEAHEIRQWLDKNRLVKLFEPMQALRIKCIVDLLALDEEGVNTLKQRLLKIEIIRFVRALNELRSVGSRPSPPKGARAPRPGGPRRRLSAKTPSIFEMHEDNVTPAENYLQSLFTDILSSLEDDDAAEVGDLLGGESAELEQAEVAKTNGAGRAADEGSSATIAPAVHHTITSWLEKHQLQPLGGQLTCLGAEFTSDLLVLGEADIAAFMQEIAEPGLRDKFSSAISELRKPP
jgi:hypothetical protein